MTDSEAELRREIEELLSDDWACTRVWEAWQYKTMSQDDFIPLNETERVDEIISLIAHHTKIVEQAARLDGRIEVHRLVSENRDRRTFLNDVYDNDLIERKQLKAALQTNQPDTSGDS